ncbi:MAG: DNA mismatch repair endonuclease MutL [Verrucomicrobiota bacterium]
MSRIHLLSEEVASQVAAGEVVERPAAVVKELVENSIDAGATRIEVLTRRGGISLIQVTDNGIGMDRDDALLCLERHATSKIRTGHDLAAIHTLGFRGEALPSIASVSHFRLSTREHNALAGTEILVNAGKIETVRDGGDAPGTQIEVRSLFYNLPARRKFLRTETTEASHVEHQLQLLSIAHPEISFVHLQDDRVSFQLPPAASLIDRIRDLAGATLASELLAVPTFEVPGIKIWGYVGRIGVSRSTRQQQLCFLNGRAVENASISQGLREGYHTALMKGQYPVTYLFIEMDPAAVDVNVHPAKREVRFRAPSEIREAIREAVSIALESNRAEWSATFRPANPFTSPTPPTQPPTDHPSLLPPEKDTPRVQVVTTRGFEQTPSQPVGSTSAFVPKIESDVSINDVPPPTASTSESIQNVPLVIPPPPPLPPETESNESFRFLGVLGKCYVLMENASGLVVVDQHAAHERILFEEMQKRMLAQGVPSQRLLLPITIELGPRDADWIQRNFELLEKAGIGLELFGVGTYKIDALPTFIKTDDPAQLLHDIIDELRDTNTSSARLRLGQDMIAKTVCRHAVKANDTLREPELVRLIEDLLACDLPYCCPHGRPTMIQMSYLELEKKFGRKV